MHTKQRPAEYKALKLDDGATQSGEFEALVAVFDNVDKVGDRIKSGAFDRTLEAWRKSGDPIPIVLAHEWSDPWAHIGYALPEHVKAIPGRGLYVSKGVLDIEDNPVARQVHRLMERRTLKEFSFGYNVPENGERKADDGAYDLVDLDLIEFGPCLKGVNDSTELLAVKSLMEAERRRENGEEPTLEERMTRLEALVMKAFPKPTETIVLPGDQVVTTSTATSSSGTHNIVHAVTDSSIEAKSAEEAEVVPSEGPEGEDSVPESEGSEEAIETPAEPEVETKKDEKVEAADEEVEVKSDPEVGAEVTPEDTETVQEEPEVKAEEEPSGPEDALAKSAEIDLMLRTQALDNLEAELGFKDEEPEVEEVETKSLDQQLAEVEAEVAPPVPFDIGQTRLEQITDQLESYEQGSLREVIEKDQVVDDTQRLLENLERELNRSNQGETDG